MKTTVEIRDDLLLQARKQARSSGTTLRALVESGLEAQLARAKAPRQKQPRIRVFDSARLAPGVDSMDWSVMRELIYAEREARIIRARG